MHSNAVVIKLVLNVGDNILNLVYILLVKLVNAIGNIHIYIGIEGDGGKLGRLALTCPKAVEGHRSMNDGVTCGDGKYIAVGGDAYGAVENTGNLPKIMGFANKIEVVAVLLNKGGIQRCYVYLLV